MPYGLVNLTSQELYSQISKGTHIGETFTVEIKRKAERSAVSTLIQHGKCAIAFFGTESVVLERIAE